MGSVCVGVGHVAMGGLCACADTLQAGVVWAMYTWPGENSEFGNVKSMIIKPSEASVCVWESEQANHLV